MVGSMLVHRLRRWTNIDPTIGECLLFAEMSFEARDRDLQQMFVKRFPLFHLAELHLSPLSEPA